MRAEDDVSEYVDQDGREMKEKCSSLSNGKHVPSYRRGQKSLTSSPPPSVQEFTLQGWQSLLMRTRSGTKLGPCRSRIGAVRTGESRPHASSWETGRSQPSVGRAESVKAGDAFALDALI